MNPILSLHGVRKLYPTSRTLFGRAKQFVHAVDTVDLEIETGSMFGLVGESGCGKSTLGNLIVGLEDVTSGKILFHGEQISGLSDAERRKRKLATKIQVVFQNPAGSLSPRKSIEFLLAEPLVVNGLVANLKAARSTLVDILEMVKLDEEVLTRFPHQLSGGQQQRVCVARALALGPQLVVLDEPTSALDVSVQAKVLNMIAGLKREMDLTYLLITHDISVVEYLCDQVAVMYLGEIVEIHPASVLQESARHPYSRLLLRSALAEHATEDAEQIGELPSAVNIPLGCRFAQRCERARPECHRDRPELLWDTSGSSVRCFACESGTDELSGRVTARKVGVE